SYAQRTIRGTVTDDEGEPLVGANVYLKGTTLGVATDINGQYRLNSPNNTGTLVISYTGFETQEVELGSSDVIDISLALSSEGLSEVVVVGYGTQIKSDLTGNIVRVKSEQIQNVPVSSVELALQGKTPGVVVEGLNGKPGQVTRIRIRGASSISANNQPLVVIDGVPMSTNNSSGGVPINPLADINPNDIASVDVLKDASAAAIYGSRGSNGVIIITTKSGTSGKPQINVNLQVGFSQPSGRRDWLNAQEYVEYLREAARNLDADEGRTDPNAFTWLGFVEGRFERYSGGTDWENGEFDTDWEDEAFVNDALFLSTDVNLSGGTNLFNYFISLAYTDQEGILVGNSFDRYRPDL
ncbi:MAG: SusC/RagA family TonB-linked outer membrane protein, partial [Bacteroidota bacterium]